ncbi:MAG: MlaD family protein [Alphaproteobacteria bacterium]|nr:MlaD family protein [Alphaproteobacteria bacterium]MDD9920138.1 MlaD family protein [Alphaproteobacteria bacterium]
MISSETKVGLLVIAALCGLGWLSIKTDAFGTNFHQNLRHLSSNFTNAEGLLVGAQVKIAGVPVGDVTDISLDGNGTATVHFTVKDTVPLSSQVQAQIAVSGLIGEKYLSLVTPVNATGELDKNIQQIPSAGIVAPEAIANNFSNVANNLEAITASLKGALAGTENTNKLQNIVNSFEGFSDRLDTMLSKEVPQGSIKDIITNLQDTTTSLKTMLSGNEAGTGEMIANFKKTAENLAALTDRLAKGEGLLGQMLVGENDQNNALVADLQAAAKGIKEITEKINGSEGTVGKLINDPTVADKLTSSLETFAGAASRLESFRTEVDLGAYALAAEDGISKGEFAITLRPSNQRYYALGITSDGLANAADSKETTNSYAGKNFGNEVKFTAQFGHVFDDAFMGQDVGFRIGLKESTGGIGLDTEIPLPFKGDLVQDKLQIATDLYDFGGEHTHDSDSPHWDIKAKLGLNLLNNGLYATFGYDNILNQEYGSPVFGLGYRFQDDDLKYVVGSAL